MNYATELFLSALGLIFAIVVVSEIVAKLIGTNVEEE